jgi:AraC-like DNA-binding protein
MKPLSNTGGQLTPVPPLSAQVRVAISQLLAFGSCTHKQVAASMGLHPRALQRRLRKEGASFGSIKDSVRRETALHYIGQSSVPLVRVAEMIGYSEASVLSRRCHHWFSSSPQRLRDELK